MAFSATKKRDTLIGNLRAQIWTVNFASVTSGTFSCGLGEVDHISFMNNVSDDQGIWTASGSTITASSVTSNDTGTVLIIGV